MKKKIMAAALAALTMMGSMAAEAARGVVALIVDDKIVVQADDILEEYTGATTFETYKNYNEGDVIYGDFNSYGIHTWYDDTTDEEIEVYVDEYWMTAEQAIDYARG